MISCKSTHVFPSKPRFLIRETEPVTIDDDHADDDVNSLPNVKISDWSKWRSCADDKISMSEKMKFGLER